MMLMLFSKHQLSVHSYRQLIQIKFFTIGLSYFLVQITDTLQLESSLMILNTIVPVPSNRN